MNPSFVLPQSLVRGNRSQSVSSSADLERLSSSPLEHYRFCRSLLYQAQDDAPFCEIIPAFEAALRSFFARTYQPSMAALCALAHILKKPIDPTPVHLFPSGAPRGDCEGIDQNYRLLPLPIAREMSAFWEEIGSREKNEKLTALAGDARLWVNRWGKSADYLFYRESEFDEDEIEYEPKDLKLANRYGMDEFLGMASFSTSSMHAAFTLSGWNTGLGVLKFGETQVRAFGPQRFELSDPGGFGIAQIGAQQPKIDVDQDHLSLSGWTRCYKDKEIWLSLHAKADAQSVSVDVRFVGIAPSPLSEKSAAAPYAMVFYIKASSCALENGTRLFPKGLHRYQGKGKKMIFDRIELESSNILNFQIIPLAGSGCFWNATFLVAFEMNASQDSASFTFRAI